MTRGRLAFALLGVAMLAWFVQATPAHAITVPNDPLFLNAPACSGVTNCVNQQWNLMSDGRGISADLAWDVTMGAGVTVAVIDSGIDFSHPDLANQIWNNPGETGLDSHGDDKRSNGIDDDHNGYVDDWRGWDFYETDNDPTDDTAYGHGTGTAGVVGAQQGNSLGPTGVAPEAKIMPLRASDTFLVAPSRAAQAIRYAADNGANVISMSIGLVGTSADLRDAVAYAYGKGVVLLDATANEFSTHPNTPAYLDQIIGVGGVVPDTDGSGSNTASDFTVRATYSNYGPGIDVVSPTDVYTTSYGGGFGTISGTSGATPGAAGVAALVEARAQQLGLTLSADEVNQIMRMSADDLVGGIYGYAVGWDQYTGWGRVDAYRAVQMTQANRIPPVANIRSPDWYANVAGNVAIQGTVSARNGSYTWKLSYGQGIEPATFTQIAKGSGTTAFTGKLGTFKPAGLPNGLYTLLLTITDARGNRGADRQAFTLLADPSLFAGFPKDLGTSVESSPKFADLNGDGKDELIVADMSGLVHAFRSNGSELPGWPVAQRKYSLPGGSVRPGFISSPAVADLNRDGALDVVIGGLDGKVYAWGRDGHALPGWPVQTSCFDPPACLPEPDPANPHWETAVLSSPAVGELDGNTSDGPEVVTGAADGKLYAFHADGSTLQGFPVLLDDPAVPGIQTAKVLSSPAIGDITGDGQNEVVIGDGESYGSTARVYAVSGDGSFLPGWPATLTGVLTNGIPVVGQGVPGSPVLTDTNGDGKLEVAIGGFTTRFHLLAGDGTEQPGGANQQGQYFNDFFGSGHDPNITTADSRSTVSNFAIGDIDRDGHPDLFTGSTDTRLFGATLHPGQKIFVQHMLSAWHMSDGSYFTAYPRLLDDWTFLGAPGVADVDGDGVPEVISGNGNGGLHAFHADGTEAVGWPKTVGRWLLASPAAGDFNGDGRTDVAVATRQGFVYVFTTNGLASAIDWSSLRGNPANTAVFVEPVA